MGETRTGVLRDRRLAAEPIERVAQRVYIARRGGSARTLSIVILGLATVGIVGGPAWLYGDPDWASGGRAEILGLGVLLGGSLAVGAVAALRPPPLSGLRGIVISALMITSLPAVLAALLALIGSGDDRAFGLELLALTVFGGLGMVAITGMSYVVVRRLLPPSAAGDTPQSIATAVLDSVQSDLGTRLWEARDGSIVTEGWDDAGGLARLELETRLLADAGYVETARERVIDEPEAPVLTALLGFPRRSPPRIRVAFEHSAREIPGVPPPPVATALAAEAARWSREQDQAAREVDDGGADLDGLGSIVRGFIVTEVLITQVVAAFLLLGSPDAIQAALSIVLAGVPPSILAATWAYRRGARTWGVAILPLFAAIGLLVAFPEVASSPEVLPALVRGTALLTLPWTAGWIAGVLLRDVRHGRRAARNQAGA